MDLQALVKYLDDEGYGEQGVDLFRDHLPLDIDVGLAVYSMSPVEIHPYIKSRRGSFQVVGRGTDVDEVRDRMKSVADAFEGMEGQTIGRMRFHYIRAEMEPMIFPRSESDLIEASVSFAFSYIQQT